MTDTDVTTDTPAQRATRQTGRRRRLRRALIVMGCIVGGILLVLGGLAAWFLWAPAPAEPDLKAQVVSGSVEVDGMTREYTAVVPDDVAADAPVIFAFHGSSMDAAAMRSVTGYRFDELAVERGFVMVYPEGYEKTWHDCRAATPYPARLDDVDDVAFVHAMVAALADEYGTSTERVFAAGLSNGGQLAIRLGAEAPDLVEAVAVFAAAYPADDNNVCEDADTPVPTMFVLGTADPINPFAGGTAGSLAGSLGTVRSAGDSAAYVAERNGAASVPQTMTFTNTDAAGDSDVTLSVYSGDDPVVLYAVEDGGHVVPNPNYAQPRVMGGTTKYLDGPLAAVDFFLGE